MMDNNDIIVEDLTIEFYINGECINIINQGNCVFTSGKITAVVGESGSGKSVLGQAVLGDLPDNAVASGQVLVGGKNMLSVSPVEAQVMYGKQIAVVPQLPTEAFSPMKTIYAHIRDALEGAGMIRTSFLQRMFSASGHRQLACDVLTGFGFTDIDKVLTSYPHELSGGMLQRVLCAMVTYIRPQWILADEPTKGLDGDNRRLVVRNLQKMYEQSGSGMIIITHDMELAGELCHGRFRLKDGRLYAEG